jgi:uncharacterized protein YycO
MKLRHILLLIPIIGAIVILAASSTYTSNNFKPGDIVFMTDNSAQGQAVKLATHSEYSHVGVILQNDNELYLYEAVQPVRRVKMSDWVRIADPHTYVVKRLTNDSLTALQLSKMNTEAIKHLGKPYDPWFGWSDENIYCSEYVWKIYFNATGIELCKPKPLKSYDLSHPLVIKIMHQRYDSIPYEEPMVAPSDIFSSEKLGIVTNGKLLKK